MDVDDYEESFHDHRARSHINQQIEALFKKKYEFRAPTSEAWLLPDASKMFSDSPWQVNSLQAEKSRLNFHKSQLNDMKIEEWSEHTRRRNPAGDVISMVRRFAKPDFLTQAWLKFYECASTYEMISPRATEDCRLVSLHLCEAPGAFISALNHYLTLHYPHMQWYWTANTLNPYYEGNSPSTMISDDRFLLRTLPAWAFGADHTGDLLEWRNAQQIVSQAATNGEILLVTADGSIDCVERPDAQEEVTSALHYCEIVTALHALAPDGVLLCKMFTMFEHTTVSALYLLTCVFQRVHVFKPATSRPGNSEVYIVCQSYIGKDNITQHLDKLVDGFGTTLHSEKALFPLDSIPQSFIQQVVECASFFSHEQCNAINSNLEAFLINNFNCPTMYSIRRAVADRFMRLHDLRPIPSECRLLGAGERIEVNTNPRHHRGSHAQRLQYGQLSAKEKIQALKSQANAILEDCERFPEGVLTWIPLSRDESFEFDFVRGKKITAVRSSRFIFNPLLMQYRKLLDDCLRDSEPADLSDPENVIKKYSINSKGFKTLHLPRADIRKYGTYVVDSLRMIIEALETLSEEETLFVTNLDALTHCMVGAVYILCSNFTEVGFAGGDAVMFRGLAPGGGAVRSLREVLAESEASARDSESLLRALPVCLTNVGEFYNTVVAYNNSVYVNKCAVLFAISS